jgi:hypothetical protein
VSTKTKKRTGKSGLKAGKSSLPGLKKKFQAHKHLGKLKRAFDDYADRNELQNLVERMPAELLTEAKSLLKGLIDKKRPNQVEPKSLKGVWANKGFENIDVEKEIRNARDAMQKQILNKHLRNELPS